MTFSTDGLQWQQYTENGVVKVRNSTGHISGIQRQFLAVCSHLSITKLKKSLSFEAAMRHRMHVLALVPRKRYFFLFFFQGFPQTNKQKVDCERREIKLTVKKRIKKIKIK